MGRCIVQLKMIAPPTLTAKNITGRLNIITASLESVCQMHADVMIQVQTNELHQQSSAKMKDVRHIFGVSVTFLLL